MLGSMTRAKLVLKQAWKFLWAGTMAAGALSFVCLSAQQFSALSDSKTPCASGSREWIEAQDERVARDPLAGMWLRQGADGDSELFRFYYFHGDGKGLYRYGRRELNQTNSFDYRVRNESLVLKFRKNGVQHETSFKLERGAQGAILRLTKDPKEPGASYRKVAPPMRGQAQAEPTKAGIGNSMWIHTRSYAKGGGEFGMYQFNAPAMDGRGVGWFHRGDFDDWSTESFRYKVQGSHLQMDFEYHQRSEQSTYEIVNGPRNTRFMTLHEDPRNYWLDRRYRHMGPSFGAHPAFAMWSDLQPWAQRHLGPAPALAQ